MTAAFTTPRFPVVHPNEGHCPNLPSSTLRGGRRGKAGPFTVLQPHTDDNNDTESASTTSCTQSSSDSAKELAPPLQVVFNEIMELYLSTPWLWMDVVAVLLASEFKAILQTIQSPQFPGWFAPIDIESTTSTMPQFVQHFSQISISWILVSSMVVVVFRENNTQSQSSTSPPPFLLSLFFFSIAWTFIHWISFPMTIATTTTATDPSLHNILLTPTDTGQPQTLLWDLYFTGIFIGAARYLTKSYYS